MPEVAGVVYTKLVLPALVVRVAVVMVPTEQQTLVEEEVLLVRMEQWEPQVEVVQVSLLSNLQHRSLRGQRQQQRGQIEVE